MSRWILSFFLTLSMRLRTLTFMLSATEEPVIYWRRIIEKWIHVIKWTFITSKGLIDRLSCRWIYIKVTWFRTICIITISIVNSGPWAITITKCTITKVTTIIKCTIIIFCTWMRIIIMRCWRIRRRRISRWRRLMSGGTYINLGEILKIIRFFWISWWNKSFSSCTWCTIIIPIISTASIIIIITTTASSWFWS